MLFEEQNLVTHLEWLFWWKVFVVKTVTMLSDWDIDFVV